MKLQDHTGRPVSAESAFMPGGGQGLPRAVFAALLCLAALSLRVPALRAQESGVVARDAGGAFYSASDRYNGRNEYLHISKMGRNGSMLWEADYDTGTDEKPVGMVANSVGLVILTATRTGDTRSFSLVYYSFDNFLVREVPGNAPGAVPVAVAADKQDNIYVALTTKKANRSRAELWKFDPYGALFWSEIFAPVNNAYARDVQALYGGEISFGVTQSGGPNAFGEYEPLALIYSANGARLR